ncbi:hypothetical protein ACCO45_005456 [Purpureocillium lilacinum]|uniref:Uncharacterized protein n=1 Tax=Purpureocillium lilacinum TaxID=33203 RepID=A0ACC4DWS6_PURLI
MWLLCVLTFVAVPLDPTAGLRNSIALIGGLLDGASILWYSSFWLAESCFGATRRGVEAMSVGGPMPPLPATSVLLLCDATDCSSPSRAPGAPYFSPLPPLLDWLVVIVVTNALVPEPFQILAQASGDFYGRGSLGGQWLDLLCDFGFGAAWDVPRVVSSAGPTRGRLLTRSVGWLKAAIRAEIQSLLVCSSFVLVVDALEERRVR